MRIAAEYYEVSELLRGDALSGIDSDVDILSLDEITLFPHKCEMLRDALRGNTCIHAIELEDCKIDPQGVPILVSAIRELRLISFLFKGTPIDAATMEVLLGAISESSQLEVICIEDMHIDADRARAIGSLLERKYLQTLSFDRNSTIDQGGLAALASALHRCVGLEWISFWRVTFQGDCSDGLAAIIRNGTTAQRLEFRHNIFAELNTEPIADAIAESQSLRKLLFEQSRSDPIDMEMIHDALARNTSLEVYKWCNTNDTGTGDRGLFGALLRNTKLQLVEFLQDIVSEASLPLMRSILETNASLKTMKFRRAADAPPISSRLTLQLIDAMRANTSDRKILFDIFDANETVMKALIDAAGKNIHMPVIVWYGNYPVPYKPGVYTEQLRRINRRNRMIREWKSARECLEALPLLPWELRLKIGAHVLDESVTPMELDAILPTLADQERL